MFLSTLACVCVSLNIEYGASYSLANENLVLTPALLGIGDVPVYLCDSAFIGSGRFCSSLFPLEVYFVPDQHSKLFITSGGNGGCIRFFQSKQVCFAFSQVTLCRELIVAVFEKGVFGFRPIWPSKGMIFIISATLDARI